MMQQGPAAQRLLVQGIVASTLQLVRSVREGRETPDVQRLMLERRRMLAELEPVVPMSGRGGSLQALRAAVVESDRTLEALLG
jgi:hypothetical protein